MKTPPFSTAILWMAVSFLMFSAPARVIAEIAATIKPGTTEWREIGKLNPGDIVEVHASVPQSDLAESDAIEIKISSPNIRTITKTLNAGDPDMMVPVRVQENSLRVEAHSTSPRDLPLRVSLPVISLSDNEQYGFEAEPNNSAVEAQPMQIGRTVYGNNDDTDFLDNKDEKPIKNYANGLDNPVRDRPGLDWFRIDWDRDEPGLVIIELDILDRDVSVNLRTYVMKKDAGATPTQIDGSDLDLFMEGSDPMELIHDREPERYSKSISRVFKRGTYYLQVNGNHPRYILRSKAYQVPPYRSAEDAVRAGSHYIINVGDAWVAQVPREGNIYKRVQNMHDTAMRCTACHPSIFSTEAVLTARKAGYPIESKSNFRYVVERIYNGPTPLYGPYNLNWQRYISIPMQSQGKHGGILIDFEKFVSGRETPTFLRYAPFLRQAWTGQVDELRKLHIDEQNGVVPADSNVGFGVRDWKVLTEAYRRTGERSYEAAAENIRAIMTGPLCDQKNIQDKIHRIWALALMAPEEGAARDKQRFMLALAIDEMMNLQNKDGGWADQIEPGRGSAVYTTGQVIWTLVQAGESLRSLPAMQKGVDYLLSQQQPFGGWFQTTTHENFRTPMRETRYAVMALAVTHPLAETPKLGWGNRDGKAAAPISSDSTLQILDALDNLWEVPKGREAEFTQQIIKLCSHADPLVRSLAAEALGRVGTEASIEPLIGMLADPVKDVWRSAAWSLRQFGNRQIGVEQVKASLLAKDFAVRRAAARVFAYQFYGMDERLDIAADLMALANDDNMWTRLEALKSLRQWFYRTGENSVKREIVDLYIDRMARPEHSAIRTNLAQGMYIMLDENLAGGVSLENNLRGLPRKRERDAIIAARRHVEQSVLIEPVLDALANGNSNQREALMTAFDGTFFAGRSYARNPTDMIDVGNDREFNFYYQPPEERLDRTFKSVLEADLSPAMKAYGIHLASFFHVPRDTGDAELQQMFLAALNDASPEVQAAALKVVREEMTFKLADQNVGLVEKIASLLGGSDAEKAGIRQAVLMAAHRNDALMRTPGMASHIEQILNDKNRRAEALIVIDSPLVDDEKALAILFDAWAETESEEIRSGVIQKTFARTAMIETDAPADALIKLLKVIALDPVTTYRERLVEKLEKSTKLRRSPRIAPVLHSGLSDASPGIRLRSLKLAQDQTEFWKEGDTSEYMLRLLIDPDPQIRGLALATVEKFDLLSVEPRFARRIMALASDAALGEKAKTILVAHKFNPATMEPDGTIQSFGIPDLEFFKEKVNPYFYVEGRDGHSCQDCHQNHNILRIAPIPLGEDFLPDDLVIQNLNSALKVVNLGDPEQSLILRKPRSPQGQGTATSESPTGLTHVGGTRWEKSTDPAYQAMLAWIRDASQSNKRRLGINAIVDSYSPDYPAKYALDGDPQTIWHTEFVGAVPGYPHDIVIDLGAPSSTSAFQYVPRQESANGRVKAWEIYVSRDGIKWGEKVASGEWPDDAAVKTVPLREKSIQFVKLKGLSAANGLSVMSAAEIIVLKAKDEVTETVASTRF